MLLVTYYMKNLDGQVLLVLVSPTVIAWGCHASKWWASLLHVQDAGGPLYPQFQLSSFYRGPERIWKIIEINGSYISKRVPSENGP